MIDRTGRGRRYTCALLGALLSLLCGVPIFAHWEDVPTTPATILSGIVMSPAGQPAPGETVLLVGLERHHMMDIGAAAALPAFHTTTDENGLFQFQLYENRLTLRIFGNEVREEYMSAKPGIGIYRLVVQPAQGHAGCISPKLGYMDAAMFRGEQSNIPDLVWVDPNQTATAITLQTRKGVALSGRALDMDGNPVANQDIQIHHDLGLHSHTGGGGAIWKKKTQSASDGSFGIKNLFPGEIQIVWGGPAYNWLQTRLERDGAWLDDRVDRLDLRLMGESPWLEVRAATRSLFEIQGRVLRVDGTPLAGGSISFATANHNLANAPKHDHPVRYDWGDHHRYLREYSLGRDGAFEFQLGTPWVRGVSIYTQTEIHLWSEELPEYLTSLPVDIVIDEHNGTVSFKPRQGDS